jgi:hypothetical protein
VIKHLIFLGLCVVLQSCLSTTRVRERFAVKVSGAGEVELVGWLDAKGEPDLYADRDAMNSNAHFPYCIAGALADSTAVDLSRFDKQRVSVTGTLSKYAALNDVEGSILPRKVLAGSAVYNYCIGENVILIEKIRVAGE